MTLHKIVEIVGTSPDSIEGAVRSAVGGASETLDHLEWLQISEIRARIEEGQIHSWQAVVKLGFKVERGG